jgi:quercetin dioxygenase-like cupin family protein
VGYDADMHEETGLGDRLRAEGLAPSGWGNGPHDRYAAHEHAYDKVIAVTDGSIRFSLPRGGATIELDTGDRLDLPAGTIHAAVVGPHGVSCLEAHLPAGALDVARRRPAGTW